MSASAGGITVNADSGPCTQGESAALWDCGDSDLNLIFWRMARRAIMISGCCAWSAGSVEMLIHYPQVMLKGSSARAGWPACRDFHVYPPAHWADRNDVSALTPEQLEAERRKMRQVQAELEAAEKVYARNPAMLAVIHGRLKALKDRLYHLERFGQSGPVQYTGHGR